VERVLDGGGAGRLREPGAGLTAHILWKVWNREKAKPCLRKSKGESDWAGDLPEKDGERTYIEISSNLRFPLSFPVYKPILATKSSHSFHYRNSIPSSKQGTVLRFLSIWAAIMAGLWERWLERAEQAGYKAANASHKVMALTLASVGMYGLYALFRDYRAYFIMRRDPQYAESIKQREAAIRKLVEKS
jgi:hypothetical protein